MDKDRVTGSSKEAIGAIKETVGKTLGDAKLQAHGESDKAQNALGGLKDALKK